MSINQDDLKQRFRPRGHILQSLRDELIGSCELVVFELVKNAYGSGPNEVPVVLSLTDREHPGISIKDDDDGILLQAVRDVWLVPVSDRRKAQMAGASSKKDPTHRQVA